MRARWERQVPGVPLVIVESPYRALAGPLVAYLDVLDRAWPPDKPEPITFVVIPEYVARHWWERILYNQSARRAADASCSGRPHTVVVDVPVPARRARPAQARGRPTGASTWRRRRRGPHDEARTVRRRPNGAGA